VLFVFIRELTMLADSDPFGELKSVSIWRSAFVSGSIKLSGHLPLVERKNQRPEEFFPLDALDHSLLALLRVDARMSVADLAKKLAVSRAPGSRSARVARPRIRAWIRSSVCDIPGLSCAGPCTSPAVPPFRTAAA